ncbi:MAG: hypothetical protein ACR2GO_03500 [Candidatus Limnocylindria bacterium]
MTGRSIVPALPPDTSELEESISAAERGAVVVWRGQRIPFTTLPAHTGRTDDRNEREGLYAGWIEALEALNPRYRRRYDAWRPRGVDSMHDLAGLGGGVGRGGVPAEE